jgi:hypothetical protein
VFPLAGAISPLGVSKAAGAVSTIVPTDIAGLAGWWKADAGAYSDAGTTLCASGDTVAQWNDQSGRGNHFTQTTATNRPTWTDDVQNLLPIILFDQTTNLEFMQAAVGSVYPAPFTIFLVAKSDADIKGRVLAGIGNNWLLGWWWNGLYFMANAYFDGVVNLAAGPQADGSFHRVTGKSDNVTGSVYLDGTLIASGGGVNGPQGLYLAKGGNGATGGSFGDERSDCQIAEIIVYDSALSDSDREAVEAYLSAKWGV